MRQKTSGTVASDRSQSRGDRSSPASLFLLSPFFSASPNHVCSELLPPHLPPSVIVLRSPHQLVAGDGLLHVPLALLHEDQPRSQGARMLHAFLPAFLPSPVFRWSILGHRLPPSLIARLSGRMFAPSRLHLAASGQIERSAKEKGSTKRGVSVSWDSKRRKY